MLMTACRQLTYSKETAGKAALMYEARVRKATTELQKYEIDTAAMARA